LEKDLKKVFLFYKCLGLKKFGKLFKGFGKKFKGLKNKFKGLGKKMKFGVSKGFKKIKGFFGHKKGCKCRITCSSKGGNGEKKKKISMNTLGFGSFFKKVGSSVGKASSG
jgi:hypothetical protein